MCLVPQEGEDERARPSIAPNGADAILSTTTKPGGHRRRYERPPIQERIVEVHVLPGEVPLQESREELRRRWLDQFPVFEEEQVAQFQLQWNPGQMAVHTGGTSRPRLRFWRTDKKRLLQASADLFAANDLLPEPGWDELGPMFRQGYEGFVAAMKPTAISKGVVRYLNRVRLPEGKGVADIFTIFPELPENRPTEAPFQMAVDMGEQESGRAAIALAFAGLEGSTPCYALELLVESTASPTNTDGLYSWAEKAHDRIDELFDQSITDTARDSFGQRS